MRLIGAKYTLPAILLALGAFILVLPWFVMPPGLWATKWPLLLFPVLAPVILLPLYLLFRLNDRALDRERFGRLPVSAGEWVGSKAKQLDLDVTVASYGDKGSAYHPASKTILLREQVHAEHTVRALSTAAHELGHAVVHQRSRWSKILAFGRWVGGNVYSTGFGLLIGCALIFVPTMANIALGLMITALVCWWAVLIDEAAASLFALRVMSAEPGVSRGQVAAAAVNLVLAFCTYLAYYAIYALPIVFWPDIIGWIGEGVLAGPADPLVGWRYWFIVLSSPVLLLGSVAAASMVVKRAKPAGQLGGLVAVVAMLIAAPYIFLVADQPTAMANPWIVVLAAGLACSVLSAPIGIPAYLLSWWVRKSVDKVAPPSAFSGEDQWRSTYRAERARAHTSDLIEEETDTWFERLLTWRGLLFYLPLLAVAFIDVC